MNSGIAFMNNGPPCGSLLHSAGSIAVVGALVSMQTTLTVDADVSDDNWTPENLWGLETATLGPV